MPIQNLLNKANDTELAGQAVRYLVATVISAILSLSFPIIFHEFMGIIEEQSVALSLCIVFIINFFVIRHYVFRSETPIFPELFKFFTTSIGFRIAEYLLFLYAFKIIGLNYILALIITLTISFSVKFVVQRSFVFNKS